MLGFPLVYFKGMRLMMFQLSGFYCTGKARPGKTKSRKKGGRTPVQDPGIALSEALKVLTGGHLSF